MFIKEYLEGNKQKRTLLIPTRFWCVCFSVFFPVENLSGFIRVYFDSFLGAEKKKQQNRSY